VSLLLFLATFDAALLDTELDDLWDDYIRQIVVMFLFPVSILIVVLWRFRNRMTEFWFSYGIPISLFLIISVWVFPSLINSFLINADGAIEEEQVTSLETDEEPEPLSQNTEDDVEPVAQKTPSKLEQKESVDPNQSLTWIFTFVTIAVVSSLLFRYLFLYRQSKAELKTPNSSTVVEKLQVISSQLTSPSHVNAATEAIYRQLIALAHNEVGITRDLTMTPREFQQRLLALGIPDEALAVITRGFERSRYGQIEPTVDELQQLRAAIESLQIALQEGQGSDHD
jgi:heme/copper-type cytochrome/quinol oxidase subunit 2